MANVIKNKLKESLVTSVLGQILSRSSRFYYFLGRTTDFSITESTPLTSSEYEQMVRSDMIYLKSVNVSDVSLVIPRIDWYPGMNLQKYDVRAEEGVNTSYAMTDLFNVYKCLDKDSALSTVKPTGTSSDPFVTADGYKWKFMYNVPMALRNKFLTNSWIPVATALSDRFFSNGSISSISITEPGSGYNQNTSKIVVSGDGVGARFTPIIQGGQLSSVVIDDAGYGYTYANIEVESTTAVTEVASASVDISSGDVVSPQSIVEMLSIRGTIDSVTVSNGGDSYTSATVNITGDGIGATASATIVDGVISRIQIVNPGKEYTHAAIVVSGDGIGATAYPNISPPLGHGRNAVSELNASALMFYSNLLNDNVGSVNILNEYRQFGIIKDPLTIAGSSFIPSPSSLVSYNVTGIFDPLDFTQGTQVTDGVNIFTVAVVVIGSTNGMVLNTSGIAVNNGTTITKVGSPSIFFTAVTSRKTEYFTDATTTTCFLVTSTFNRSDYLSDSILYTGTNRFRVISSSDTQLLLHPIGNSSMLVNDVLNIEGGLITLTVDSFISPSIDKATGDILFVDNRLPFNQTEDQAVTFRTVIKV